MARFSGCSPTVACIAVLGRAAGRHIVPAQRELGLIQKSLTPQGDQTGLSSNSQTASAAKALPGAASRGNRMPSPRAKRDSTRPHRLPRFSPQ